MEYVSHSALYLICVFLFNFQDLGGINIFIVYERRQVPKSRSHMVRRSLSWDLNRGLSSSSYFIVCLLWIWLDLWLCDLGCRTRVYFSRERTQPQGSSFYPQGDYKMRIVGDELVQEVTSTTLKLENFLHSPTGLTVGPGQEEPE